MLFRTQMKYKRVPESNLFVFENSYENSRIMKATADGCDVFFHIFGLICLKHKIYGKGLEKFKSDKYPNTPIPIKVISSF